MKAPDTVVITPRPHFPVRERIDYIKTAHLIVSLCVVGRARGYRWHRKDDGTWRVDLAKQSVRDLDLRALAEDALTLVRKHSIQLSWSRRLSSPC
jgi:hypothetical protein